jgi:tRNA threonylcarbamoyladenosine biosynthesis protein TsaE
MKNKITIHTLDVLTIFAKELAKRISGGEVLLLSGELGAGKTTFVQELVKALGSNDRVTSPTFVIRNEYKAEDLSILHIDLYRLEKSKVSSLEFLDMVGDFNVITCIEWPERITDLKNLHGRKIALTITILMGDTREIFYT